MEVLESRNEMPPWIEMDPQGAFALAFEFCRRETRKWWRSMDGLLELRVGWALALFAVLDIFCVGLGMGVPIFCILLGLPVGWYIARRTMRRGADVGWLLGKMLLGAGLTSSFTLVMMAVLWGPSAVMLFDPTADLAEFGMPLILYEPLASFVAWLVLMIVISPFLQFLMTLFGSHITVLWRLSRGDPAISA
jgi:hypothetical protein